MQYIVDGREWSVEQLMHEITEKEDDIDDRPMDRESEEEDSVPIGEEDVQEGSDSELSTDDIVPSTESGGSELEGPSGKRLKSKSFRGKDGKTVWSGEQPEKRGRPPKKNLVTHLPGPKGLGKSAKTPLSSWLLIFSQSTFDILVKHTNEEISRRLEVATLLQSYHKLTDEIEIKALLGLLYLIGVQKSAGIRLEELWSPRFGSGIYRATMSMRRFKFLCSCLRFDDSSTRSERRVNDKFAPIRDLWEIFISNCSSLYTPFEYCTIDEQLLGFRGRCPFRIYMAAKPDKYGMKVLMMNDARTWYMVNAIPYTGKVQTQTEAVPTYYVRNLTQSIHHTGRNVTVDNWFSSVPLFDLMLKNYKITMLGTMRKNKREIPPMFIQSAAPGTVKVGYSQGKTLISYTPKKNKVVLVMSTMHDSVHMDQKTSKPNLIMDYNSTKGGTDTFDQLCHEYTTARGTRRWPMRYFFGMLDQGAINALVLFKLNVPMTKLKRRDFLHDLSWELTCPLVAIRYEKEKLTRGLKETIHGVLDLPEPVGNDAPIPVGRARCHMCPRSKDKKTGKICSECKLHVCNIHSDALTKCHSCIE